MYLLITLLAVFIIAASVTILGIFAAIFFTFYTGVPYAPTPKSAIKKIIDKLEIKPGQKIYDLGCGDGRFLFAAEKAGANVIGFEISPAIYLKAKINKFFQKSKAKIYYKNFFSVNLAEADVIFCFLVDSVMSRLEKKLQQELKPGAKVISYGFHFPGWNLSDTILPDWQKEKTGSKIFIYQK